MRPPTSSQKIYHQLKEDIELRRLIPGSQMLTEPELADKYQVARNTLRKVLSQLEEEKYLVRKVGKGTFVRDEETLPVIYFLIPHANYMTQCDNSSSVLREYLHGAMVAVNDYNCRIETLVFSDDNDNRHINLQRFERLNSKSLVIVPGVWFFPAFKLLQEKNCRVALIQNQSFHVVDHADEIAGWIQLIHDRRSGIYATTLKLAAANCRKIALANAYLLERLHPIYGGYCDALQTLKLPVCGYDLTSGTREGELAEFYEKEKFDGLIVNAGNFPRVFTDRSVNAFLGIPETVKVVLLEYMENCCRFGNFYGTLSFSGLQIGYDAVKCLMATEGAVVKTYEPALLIRS